MAESVRQIIYVDMDGVLCDYMASYTLALAKEPRIQFPQSQYGFFRNLKPIKEAIESVQLLQQMGRYELYILTAPSIENPLCYTEKRDWVETHLGMDMVAKLIISPNKGLNKGHFLIDDHQFGRGQEHFEGKLLHFGSPSFPNWPAIVDFLKANLE